MGLCSPGPWSAAFPPLPPWGGGTSPLPCGLGPPLIGVSASNSPHTRTSITCCESCSQSESGWRQYVCPMARSHKTALAWPRPPMPLEQRVFQKLCMPFSSLSPPSPANFGPGLGLRLQGRCLCPSGHRRSGRVLVSLCPWSVPPDVQSEGRGCLASDCLRLG